MLHLGSSKGCHWTEVASLAYRCHQCCLLLHLQVVKKKGKQKVIKVKTCESELSKARQKKHKKKSYSRNAATEMGNSILGGENHVLNFIEHLSFNFFFF